MDLTRFKVEDVDQLFSWESLEWESDYLQLTPGPLGISAEEMHLPGFILIKMDYSGSSFRSWDKRLEKGVTLALTLSSMRPVQVGGRNLLESEAALWLSGGSIEAVISPETRYLTIDVSPAIIAACGWEFVRGGVATPSPKGLRQLKSTCLEVFSLGRQPRRRDATGDSEVVQGIANRLSVQLGTVFEPWLVDSSETGLRDSTARKQEEIVLTAEKIIRSWDGEESLTVPELAFRLGVSDRTLFRLFRQWAQVGPKRYQHLWQIHQFRQRLLEIGPEVGAITRAARETGFDHLSQLSRSYRNHFGETPRETLYRRFGRRDG